MLDLRAEVRQSSGEVKPRNVRGRCQKTTTMGAPLQRTSSSCRTYCARLDALCRVMQQNIPCCWRRRTKCRKGSGDLFGRHDRVAGDGEQNAGKGLGIHLAHIVSGCILGYRSDWRCCCRGLGSLAAGGGPPVISRPHSLLAFRTNSSAKS